MFCSPPFPQPRQGRAQGTIRRFSKTQQSLRNEVAGFPSGILGHTFTAKWIISLREDMETRPSLMDITKGLD